LVHLELAELARQSGDERAWREELSEAHRLFTEIGASAYAERVAGELGERRASESARLALTAEAAVSRRGAGTSCRDCRLPPS
jgi:hypothetical protein